MSQEKAFQDAMSIQQLVLRSKEAYGLTWKEMGAQLGRSEKMIRKLAKGEVPGEKYRTSLTELYDGGQVRHLTPRRRSSDGSVTPVRAKREAGQKSVRPVDTKGLRVPSAKRGRFSHEITNLPGGNRISTTQMPKSQRSAGRAKGWRAIREELRRVARSQARVDKRVKIQLVIEDEQGLRRQVSIGSKAGYHASDIISDVRTKFAGSMEAWAKDQLQGAGSLPGSSAPQTMEGQKIMGMTQQSFNAQRSKEERKAQDSLGLRRRTGSRRFGAGR